MAPAWTYARSRPWATAGLIIAGSFALAACGGGGSLPVTGPDASGSGGAVIGSTSGVPAHRVAVGRGSTTAATLDVESGATSVDVAVGSPISALLTATTPAGSGQVPALVTGTDHSVDLQLRSIGGGGPLVVQVTLSPLVVWTINLDGGATVERVDLRGGHLAAINLGAGVSRADVYLPPQRGTQNLRETGGVSALTVTVPATVAVKVRAGGGAGSVQLNGTTHSGVSGGSTFSDPGFATAPARAYLDLSGGVSAVVVRREARG
jgi:hypothetical protein